MESDDALITLRTVLNVTHGFGLRYNILERVQTFTHPLWLGLVTAAYYLTWNVYVAAGVRHPAGDTLWRGQKYALGHVLLR